MPSPARWPDGLALRGAIAHCARQFQRLGKPATVFIPFHFNPEGHGRSRMPPSPNLIQGSEN